MKKLLIAIVAAFVMGAASQYTYTKAHHYKAPVTGARAAEYLAMFRDDSAWPVGAPASWLRHCLITRVEVDETYTAGLAVQCKGVETDTVSADLVPDGAHIDAVIP